MNRIIKKAAIVSLCLAVFPAPLLAGSGDDTLRVSVSRETDFVDPIHTSSPDGDLFGLILFDTLVYVDRQTREYKPLLAESWEWIDDRTVEFRLRQGITFHNGEAFDADDVVYTFQLLMDMDNGFRQQQQDFGNIDSVEKLDAHTVRVHLKQPQPTFENVLASRIAIWPNEYTEAGGHLIHSSQPVGTGPYRLESMTKGSSYTLVANENYFDGPRPPAGIGKVLIRVIPEVQTQIAELMAGQIDMAMNLTGADAAMLEGMPGITVQSGPSTRMYFLSLNAADETDNPLHAEAVRRAVALAINRPEMTEMLVGSHAVPLFTQCNPAQSYCLTDIEPLNAFDPETARALLGEAGFADGFPINLRVDTSQRAVGEAIQGYLEQVGIKVDLESLPLPAWRERYINGESQMSVVPWGQGVTSADISNTLGIFFNQSSTDYVRDPDLTAWTAEAAVAMDPEHRADLYRKILTRINERAYIVPLFAPPATYVSQDEVEFDVPVMDFPDLSLVRWKQN